MNIADRFKSRVYPIGLPALVGALLLYVGGTSVCAQTNCLPPPAGLAGWWPGEGNANDIVGANNGVLVGGTSFAGGKVGQAFSFDGISNAVTNAVPGLTNILNSYTMEFWAWPLASRASTPESTDGTVGNADQRYAIFPNNGRFGAVGSGVSLGTNGVSVFEHGSAYLPSLLVYDASISGWTHVAVVYSNQQPRLYLNGSLARTGLVSPRSSYPSTSFGDAGLGYGFYAGLLDEVSIYNRALSAAEILALYNAGSAGKCAPASAPLIVSQPTNQTVNVGGTATFMVTASGTQPLSYQWKFNGTNLPGATLTSLSLTNIQLNQAGNYGLRVTNVAGFADSSNAVLTVNSNSGLCAMPPAGLITWWPAEGNGNDLIGSNNGVLLNGTGFTNGLVGIAFNFDGVDDIIVASNSPSLNFGSDADFSIEGWIRALPNSTSFDVTSIVDKREAPNTGQSLGYEFGLESGRLHCRISDSISDDGSAYTATGADLRDGIWHHIALTIARSSTNGGQFYLDGTPIGTFDPTTEPGSLSNSAPLLLGENAEGASVNTAFKGAMDEISIYGRALSAAEIQAIYAAGSGGKCRTPYPPFFLQQPVSQSAFTGDTVTFNLLAGGSAPLSYQWSFKGTNIIGATGTTLTLTNLQLAQGGDYAVQVTNSVGSTNSTNAVLTVMVTVPCAAAPTNLVSWWRGETNAWDSVGGNNGTLSNNVIFAKARVGQGFVFDGNGAVVRIGNPVNLQLQDFTIESWIRRSSSTVTSLDGNGNGHIFGYETGGYGVYLDPTGHPTLTRVGINSVTTGAVITDTNFHHVAVTKIGSSVVFYLDGVAYPAPSYNPGFTFTSSVWIGGIANNNSFYGVVDEVSVYNRSLSAGEVQGIYAAGTSGKCVTLLAPFIITQPTNQTVTIGSNVTVTLGVGGSPPFSYQWSFKGTNLPGATNYPLVLSNIQTAQAGNYSVTITNAGGSITSSNALISVNFPSATVRAISTNGAAGGTITVPITLVANGNESALGFSLNFDVSKLTYAGAALGSGATGAVLMANTSVINSGKLGIGIFLPGGNTFISGTQEAVRVTFVAAVIPTASVTSISFGDQPSPRQLLDSQINTLPAFYSNATVSISAATAFEGDVFPRPNGDTNTALSDWLMVGRYAARLDYPTNASEFQRADCAPRSSLGDGAIKVSDWVQAGRYAFGLDPLTAAGGPTNEIAGPGPVPSANRIVSVGSTSIFTRQTGTIGVTLSSQGNENAVGFTLSFDPTVASFAGANLGSGATGAAFYLNTSQLAFGRIGFVMALGTGSSFTSGTKELLQVSFQASSTASSFSPGFTDLLVTREVSDPTGNALPVSYVNGTVTVNPLPSLKIAKSGTNIDLSWPVSATNFGLQEIIGILPPGATWSNVLVTASVINNENVVTLPLSSTNKFYRLYHP